MKGTQTHLEFIPERTTDFVFAAFASDTRPNVIPRSGWTLNAGPLSLPNLSEPSKWRVVIGSKETCKLQQHV